MDSNIAAKVEISDLIEGEFVKQDSEPSYVKTKRGEISKLRILETVVDKYVSDDSNYAALTLDDSTETIRAKLFKDSVKQLSEIEIGHIVDILGSVKEYEGEIYIAPQNIKKITDPNWELLRKLELNQSSKQTAKIPEDIDMLVLKKIKELDSGEGAKLEDLLSNLNHEENNILESVRNLMMKGDLFEPKKDFLKMV